MGQLQKSWKAITDLIGRGKAPISVNIEMDAPDAKQRAKIKNEEVTELINYLADFEEYMPNPDVIMQKTGKGISIFKEMMYDPHIAGMVDARKSGLGKLEIKTVQNDATDDELLYINELIKNRALEFY